ncbi:hypothetical protein PM082_023669 [Marasmius tenuissimus]|nr:hypothetical protein PM082_023669 [Marasmius tenuissimus]
MQALDKGREHALMSSTQLRVNTQGTTWSRECSELLQPHGATTTCHSESQVDTDSGRYKDKWEIWLVKFEISSAGAPCHHQVQCCPT